MSIKCLEVRHKANSFVFTASLLLRAVGTSGVYLPHHLYSGDLLKDSSLRPGYASQLLHPKRLEPAGFCHRHCWVRIWSPGLLPVHDLLLVTIFFMVLISRTHFFSSFLVILLVDLSWSLVLLLVTFPSGHPLSCWSLVLLIVSSSPFDHHFFFQSTFLFLVPGFTPGPHFSSWSLPLISDSSASSATAALNGI